MISLKKYLDSDFAVEAAEGDGGEQGILAAVLAAYGSALLEMGRASVEACAGSGLGLKLDLGEVQDELSVEMSREALAATDQHVRERLQVWADNTARHYAEKAHEVRDLLLVMARTAAAAGARDQRCARRMHDVTDGLRAIASLDDLTEMRASIKVRAMELKASIEQMSAENRQAITELRGHIATYKAKLKAAEETASRDALTRVRNRLYVEGEIGRRMASGAVFSVAILDIDGFKEVNDEHGHLTGDALLKQFAAELQSVCRSTDTVGRWGGDEFIVLLESGLAEAMAQIERLKKWVCGNYEVQVRMGVKRLQVKASIGLAEWEPGEGMEDLLARADASMYEQKAASSMSSKGLRVFSRRSTAAPGCCTSILL